MKILLVAGEVSSDRYAAEIAKALKAKDPSVELYGVGGKLTAKEVDHFVIDIAHENAIGITEVIGSRRFFQDVLLEIESFLISTPVDRVVLLDFPHYHDKLASLFKAFQLPIYTFITPNFWIWGHVSAAKKVATYSKAVITIFKQEYELYRRFGSHIYYFGHPLWSCTSLKPMKTMSEAPLIGIFPGSRKQEIKYHLPVMLDTIKELMAQRPATLRCQVVQASPTLSALIQDEIRKAGINVDVVDGRQRERVLGSIDAMITVAGTVTLEAVLYNIPQVIVGRFSWLTYLIATYILRLNVPYIGLPNIVAKREVVAEFRQGELKVSALVPAVKALLDPEKRRSIAQDYEHIQDSMKGQGGDVFTEVAALLLRKLS